MVFGVCGFAAAQGVARSCTGQPPTVFFPCKPLQSNKETALRFRQRTGTSAIWRPSYRHRLAAQTV